MSSDETNLSSNSRTDRLKRRRNKKEISYQAMRLPWLWFGAPGLILISIIFVVPLIALANESFFADVGPAQLDNHFSFDNYVTLLTDPFYFRVLLNTVFLGLVVVAACALLAYPVAYYLVRTTSRLRPLYIFIIIGPLLVSVVIRNLGWVPLLSSSGPINWILIHLGIIKEPLKLLNNFTGVAIGLVHSLLPYMILSLMTNIQRIDVSLENASLSLGATPLRTFWRVLLPLTRPGLLSGYLLVLTAAISAFTTPAVLGGRRVQVMSVLIEQQVHSVLQYGLGATLSVVLMATALLISAGSMIAAKWSERAME